MPENNCTCPIRPGMTYEDIITDILRAGKNCCHPKWICSHLDKELRRAEAERDRRKWYNKRLEKQGLSKEEIKNMPLKRRRTETTKFKVVEL